MITLQQALFTRLTGDTAANVSLQAMLGSSGRIFHALENQIPNAPGLVYKSISSIPNHSDSGDDAQILDEIVQFSIYSARSQEIKYRLLRLLDNYDYPNVGSEIASIRSVWEWTGPEMFDDDLKVARLDMRFRFMYAPLAQAKL